VGGAEPGGPAGPGLIPPDRKVPGRPEPARSPQVPTSPCRKDGVTYLAGAVVGERP
jgi:hypothetical protein